MEVIDLTTQLPRSLYQKMEVLYLMPRTIASCFPITSTTDPIRTKRLNT
jgi:hypothetical protein